MGHRFLVTAKIGRARRSRQVRVFEVRFPRSLGPWSASCAQNLVAMKLMLERIERRGPQANPGPGRKGPPKLHVQVLWFRELLCICPTR